MFTNSRSKVDAVQRAMEMGVQQRAMEVERRAQGAEIKGDFEGSVTGVWMGRNKKGAAVVSYKNKNYVTVPLGLVSLPKGAQVELSYAKGIYYSKY